MKKAIQILFCFIFCLGATWDTPKATTSMKYETQGQVKYWSPEKAYEESKIDSPDKGFYRYASDYTMPTSWPEWVAKRFTTLRYEGVTDKVRENMWEKPSLQANTKWMDAKADKNIGHIEIRVPTFSHFTFVMTDPNDGIVDQDFQGTARIYGLNDDKQYVIYAFDAAGILGTHITAISDKYIRIFDESWLDPSFSGQYSHTLALHAFEDPNRDVWIASQDPLLSGVSFYFPVLTAYDVDGQKRWNYRPLMGYNAPDDWEAGIFFNRTDGSVIYAIGRVPYIKPGWRFNSTTNTYYGYSISDPAVGHIAKIVYSGSTDWQQDKARVAYKIVPNSSTTGWVYVGNNWASGDYDYYGSLGQIDTSGVTRAWGNGSQFITVSGYKWKSLVKTSENHYIAAGRYDQYTDKTGSGTATADSSCSTSSASYAFDNNNGTYWWNEICCTAFPQTFWHWIQYDFGAGNAYAIKRIYIVPNDGESEIVLSLAQWIVEASNNGADWITLIDQSTNDPFWGWGSLDDIPAIYFDNSTKYRYYRLKININCKSWGATARQNCDATDWCDIAPELYVSHSWKIREIYLDDFEPYASLHKIHGLSGVSEGSVLSSVSFPAGREFYDVCLSRDQDRIAAIGYSSGNSVFVVAVDNNLNTIQERTLTIGTEGRSIQPTKDGGYVICGTLIESGTTKLFLSKLGKDLSPQWTQYFIEPGAHASVGRYAIETDDGGIMAVGGSYPTVSTSKVYIVKLDRFYRSCSPGTVCE